MYRIIEYIIVEYIETREYPYSWYKLRYTFIVPEKSNCWRHAGTGQLGTETSHHLPRKGLFTASFLVPVFTCINLILWYKLIINNHLSPPCARVYP